eukprot:gene17888-21338_t
MEKIDESPSATSTTTSEGDGVNGDDIAIVGIGLRLPGGAKTPQELWQQLMAGFDGVTAVPKERWSTSFHESNATNNHCGGFLNMSEWKCFDPLFFGISPKEAPFIDPQQRLLMSLAWEAMEDAGIQPSTLRGTQTGVYMGISNHDYLKMSFNNTTELPPYTMTGTNASIVANRISFAYDFRGPSMTVDTACSSSLVAVGLAMAALRSGECDAALAGGANALLDPSTSVAFSSLGVLNPAGRCRPFDAAAGGYVRSEGAGIVVLKRASDAVESGDRIYAIIRGSSFNEDGNKASLTTPSPTAQVANIESALSRANINPADIYYVEAHGTGTSVGDPIEAAALSSVFGDSHNQDNPLLIGSIKSNIGHLESAAGIASLIKVALMLQNRAIVPTINFDTPNPAISFDHLEVVREVIAFPDDRMVSIGVNSFGFGGSNCHLVLDEAPPIMVDDDTVAPPKNSMPFLVPVSAASKASLDTYIKEIQELTTFHHTVPFAAFASHQSNSRDHLSHRRVVLARDWADFVEHTAVISSVLPAASRIDSSPPVAFVFCGQGPQWHAMGKTLYATQPAYRSTVDYINKLLQDLSGSNLLEQLESMPADSPLINTPAIAQPSLFLLQAGLISLYQSWGVTPSLVIGHSFGEVTAAYACGAVTLETAVEIVHHRSVLQNLTIGTGKMLVVGMSAETFKKDYANDMENGVEIACYNAADSIVVTGAEEPLNKVMERVRANGLTAVFLRSPCSFHSSHQKKIKSKVLESLANIKSVKPSIPYYSTVTGSLYSGPFDARYIYSNLRKPVLFEAALLAMGASTPGAVFLEIAPNPTLAPLVAKCLDATVITSLSRTKDESTTFAVSIAHLYCAGVALDFGAQFLDGVPPVWREMTASMPRYKWDTDVYWHETTTSKDNRTFGPSTSILGSSKSSGITTFESTINVKMAKYAFLKEHRVKGRPVFPGAGYIENIAHALAGQDVLVHSLEFLAPLMLEEGEPMLLQTSIDEISRTESRINFYFRDSASNRWTHSCTGRAGVRPPAETTTLDANPFSNFQGRAEIGKEALYSSIAKLGLLYGPAFQRIESITIGETTSVATMSYDPSQASLNTCTIDACFHGLLAMLDNNRTSTSQHFVVEKIEGLVMHNDGLYPRAHKAGTKPTMQLFTQISSQSPNSVVGSATLMDDRGNMVLTMRRFTVKSLDKAKSRETIKFPTNQVFSVDWQTKEAPLPTPIPLEGVDPLADLLASSRILTSTEFSTYCAQALSTSLASIGLTPDMIDAPIQAIITSLSIDPKHVRFITRLLDILKSYPTNAAADQESLKQQVLVKFPEALIDLQVIDKAVTVLPRLLQGQDAASYEMFENNLLSNFYITSKCMTYFLERVASDIAAAIEPQIATKRVLRILEVGAGTGSLTHKLLPKLDALLSASNAELEIEYTFTDITASFVTDMREKMKDQMLSPRLHVRFSTLDIERDIDAQYVLPGTFDVVVMSYVIHAVADLPSAVRRLYRALAPRGWLLMIEPAQGIVFSDIVFGCFSQWWQFADHLRHSHCSITPTSWITLLGECGFDSTTIHSAKEHSFIVHSQKQDITSLPLGRSVDQSSKIKKISWIARSPEHATHARDKTMSVYIREASIHAHDVDVVDVATPAKWDDALKHSIFAFFVAGVDTLAANYREMTDALVSLVRHLVAMPEPRPTLVVLTRNAQMSSHNYLNASLIGVARTAASEYPNLPIVTIDLDDKPIPFCTLVRVAHAALSDREFAIRNNQVLVPRIHRAPNLLKSQAYATPDELDAKLSLGLDYIHTPRAASLTDYEVEVEVKATGINFKDYLYSRSLLPPDIMRCGDIYHPPFGLECSGVVSRTGPLVTNFKAGDSVLGFARHSLGSRVITRETLLVSKPDSLSFVQAASIPVVYCTAYYALFHIARLDIDDVPLIHGATGGVGLAALNLLKARQITQVLATAGSDEKRDYLTNTYSNVSNVFTTRDTSFTEETMKATNGKGADVLLNTLSGDFMPANFASMASFGRIVDLSVTHIYANEPLDLGGFKRDISYSAVDLERLIDEKPAMLNKMLKEIVDQIATGSLALIPVESVPATQTKSVIERMSERTHIGKLVVDMSGDIIVTPRQVQRPGYKITLKGTAIVTGQDGIALELIRWLRNHSNVSNIIVISKSVLKPRLELLMKERCPKDAMGNERASIVFERADVACMETLTLAISQALTHCSAPVKAVFHLATVYDDRSIPEVTSANITAVHGPKVMGAINLHRLSIVLGWRLSAFVLFSSITALTGYPSQTAYNSANIVLDALAAFRQTAGLPALAVAWGPLAGEGKVASSEAIAALFASRGLPALSLSRFFGALEASLSSPVHQLVVSPIEPTQYYDSFPHMRPKMAHLVEPSEAPSNQACVANESSLHDRVLAKVAELLSISPSKLSDDTKLKDYGLDSLLTVQFKSWIDKEFEKNLFSHIQLSTATIASVTKGIANKGQQTEDLEQSDLPSSTNAASSSSKTGTPKIDVQVNVSPLPEYVMTGSPSTSRRTSIASGNASNLVDFRSSKTLPSPLLLSALDPRKNLQKERKSSLSSSKEFISLAPRRSSILSPQSKPMSLFSPSLGVLSMGMVAAANNPFILGMGTAVPSEPYSQKDLANAMSKDFSDDPKVVAKVCKIFEQSHIATRCLARNPLEDATSLKRRASETISDVNKVFMDRAPLMSAEACEHALSDWGGSRSDITHIVSVSSTGVIVPDINFLMIQTLGLNPDVERISINFMGCLAGLSSLRAATSVAAHHPRNRVLVVCTEICSTHFTTRPGMDQIVASSIFADGSAAYVLGCNPTIYETPLYEVLGAMNRSVPGTASTMTWDISTSGWDLGLDASIPHHIGSGIEPFVKQLIDKMRNQTQTMAVKDYEFLIHTGGKAILMSIENALGIDPQQNKHSWEIYENYGNMSSASVLFVMDKARRDKQLPQYSVSLAFGPGLAFEGCGAKNIENRLARPNSNKTPIGGEAPLSEDATDTNSNTVIAEIYNTMVLAGIEFLYVTLCTIVTSLISIYLTSNYFKRQLAAKDWEARLARLDLTKDSDVDEAIKHIVGFDYPFEAFLSLNFCFYRTFCSPTIASVYYKTGTIYDTPDKRACDTDLLMHIWMDYGLDSEEGKKSYEHLNKIHGLHSKTTKNVDFVFVLCCLVVDAIQFCNDYGFRPILDAERQAIWKFYYRVGQRMNLTDVPLTLEECYKFVHQYTEDNRSARVSNEGEVLTKAITDLVCQWYYLIPAPICRIAASVILYQMSATFHAKLGLAKPSNFEFALINSVLWLRRSLILITPPRSVPYKLSDVIMKTNYGCPVAPRTIPLVGPVEMLSEINKSQ